VLLFGLGCGHLLNALLEKGFDRVLVYEPSMEILAGVLASVDLSGVLACESVILCGDLTGFISEVRKLDGFDTLLGYAAVPYKLAFAQEFLDFNTRVNNAHITNKVCIKTDIDSRENWIENYFENIRHLPECPRIDSLRAAFKGVPMIIAGAGPSLEKNAHLLTTLQQNLDLFFQGRKAREHLLLEQREALSKIAFLASQLRDLLPNNDSEESALLNTLLAETEHRL